MAYDPKCQDLAEHFIGSRISEPLRKELAQHIQDEIESWIEAKGAELQSQFDQLGVRHVGAA